MRRISNIARARRAPRLVAALLLGLAFAACDDGEAPLVDAGVPLPDRFVIGVLQPPNAMEGGQPEFDIAVERINAAGGILGQVPLALRRVSPEASMDGSNIVALAEQLVADPEVVAIIGPGVRDALLEVATTVVDADVPFFTSNATSDELQRAFAGSPFVWRTKTSDIGQLEFTLRTARRQGVERIGLVTALGPVGDSFFNWFGFYATNLGFAADDVLIRTISDDTRPEDVVPELLDADLDMVVLALPDPMRTTALATGFDRARGPNGQLPLRVVLADTGIDLPSLVAREELFAGFEGWVTTFTEESGLPMLFEAAGVGLPSDAPAGHDAVLLIAYGLEVSGGEGGAALAAGIAEAVAGDGEAIPVIGEGVRRTLEALRRGERPDIQGSTGTLAFDPIDGVDLQQPTIGHWTTEGVGEMQRFTIDETIDLSETGGLELRRARSMFVPPMGSDAIARQPQPTRTVALILSASATWENYRHQADALRQYQRLRAAGVPDDDIVMVGMDDVADDPQNALPGVVRNVPGGPDLRAGVVYDYDVLSPAQVAAVLAGEVSEDTPIVLPQDETAALYVYLVGHGGLLGLALEADSAEAGLSAFGQDQVLTPGLLTETLCGLRAAGGMPQATIIIESCYAGVFGEADFDGLEAGCADGETTLDHVLLMTAANSVENSLGTGYDQTLRAWVGDEFSVALSDRLDAGELSDMLSLYRDIYESVSGSHVSLYNSSLNPDLGMLPAGSILNPIGE